MDDLNEAIAYVQQAEPVDKPWRASTFGHGPLPDAIATILNAALSGDLMPRSDHLAAMAAGNEAAASAFMDAVWDALKADANDLRKQQRILEAYRALTTADQQAALDRVKRAAVERERDRCAEIAMTCWADRMTAASRFFEMGYQEAAYDTAIESAKASEAEKIAAAIRTPDAPASADAGRAG